MKSSEQVFNNRRISNYHATVTGMHTSVFRFLSLCLYLLLSLSLCFYVCFPLFHIYTIIGFIFNLKIKPAAVLQYFLAHHVLLKPQASIAAQSLQLVCIVEEFKGGFQYITLWVYIYFYLLLSFLVIIITLYSSKK